MLESSARPLLGAPGRLVTLLFALACLLSAAAAAGQDIAREPTTLFAPIKTFPPPVAGAAGEEPVRACEGCPPRRPIRATLQALGVNLAFNLFARLRTPPDEFQVTPASWWENLSHGFEWDYNTFKVNQFGHPYQGSLYFNAGRANGLGFWESAPLAAFGSATWEYFGERNHASINDFVTTTLGGVALGEMFHRAAWLIRDTRLTGRSRTVREILATAVDPVTGANRFMSGDAHRVSENPPDLKPAFTVSDFEVGVQWNGRPNERAVRSDGDPFVATRLAYNDISASPFKVPYDAFGLTLYMGGGQPISEATVRGRLYGRFLGKPATDRPTQFLVAQAYDYQSNGVFEYGGQSIVFGLSHVLQPSQSVRLDLIGVGGPILLGAIRSGLVSDTPADGEAAEAEPRDYDFGPGAEVSGGVTVRVRGVPIVRFTYGGFFIHTASAVEGVSGQHYAQIARLELLTPRWRSFRLGFSGEYLDRTTHYADIPTVHQWLPQFRVFLARVSR